eukprot:3082105-Pleurochrysis_carterae.AAC.1
MTPDASVLNGCVVLFQIIGTEVVATEAREPTEPGHALFFLRLPSFSCSRVTASEMLAGSPAMVQAW